MVQMTVTDANDKRLMTVVLMIIAVAHGTVLNKILAVQQARSAEGFICKGWIKLPWCSLRSCCCTRCGSRRLGSPQHRLS